MSGEHTPGPWRTEGMLILSGDGDSERLVSVLGGADAPASADAHLIAAAPEMLALLQHLHEDLARYLKMAEETWTSASVTFGAYADDCARLIAKAEGRQP